jgi:sugar phosphate isomerase/epimerase
MDEQAFSRRKFLAGGSALAAAVAFAGTGRSVLAASPAMRPDSRIRGVQVGAITYSFRSMSDQSAAAVLRYCVESGISAIELMGDPAEAFAGIPPNPDAARLQRVMARSFRPNAPPLTPEEQAERTAALAALADYEKVAAAWRARASIEPFEKLRRMYEQAGVRIYAFKPSTFEVRSTDAEIDYGLRAAKALGAAHVTVELPTDPAQSLRLGRAAETHGMKVGYHQHLQATPTLWDVALAQSPANGINLDIGHFVAAGDYDALAFIRKNHARILSMHVKDRKSKANGQANLAWGSGDTPLVSALQLMREEKYAFPATIELEYEVPAGSDAVAEVRKCVAYCRQALAAA